MKKTIKTLIILITTVALSCGCGSNNNVIKENYIYYLNVDKNSLEKFDYHIENENVYQVVPELFTEMSKDSVEGDYFATVPSDLAMPEFEISRKVLTLYFDTSYNDMSPTEEILFRAALVLTMVQLEEVSYVNVYVGEQPLTDSNGAPIGNMTKNDFVDISGELDELDQKITLSLYYPTQKGDMLYANTFEGKIESNTSYEEVVMDKLSGKAFSKDTEIYSIMTRNDICYVDFSNDFILDYLGIDDEVAIYSIVNSLCDLPNVSGVEISVDSRNDLKFHENISLDQVFHSNLDIVE